MTARLRQSRSNCEDSMAMIKRGKGKVTGVTTKDENGKGVEITAGKDGKRTKKPVEDPKK